MIAAYADCGKAYDAREVAFEVDRKGLPNFMREAVYLYAIDQVFCSLALTHFSRWVSEVGQNQRSFAVAKTVEVNSRLAVSRQTTRFESMDNHSHTKISVLEDRAILSMSGADKRNFLQGIITNDINRVADGSAIYSYLLNAQGRFVYDLFISQYEDTLLIDCEADRKGELLKHLNFRKLKSDVLIEDVSTSLRVTAFFSDGPLDPLDLDLDSPGCARRFADGVLYVDPRTPAMGVRGMLSTANISCLAEERNLVPVDDREYQSRRIWLGLPDSARDMEANRALPLEYCADLLNAIDWDKGCYTGQELTARLKHQSLIKRRLALLSIEGAPPAPGEAVSFNGTEVGHVTSSANGRAVALLRVEALRQALSQGNPFSVGDTHGYALRPPWTGEDYV